MRTAVAVLVVIGSALGQITLGRISGTVVDSTGAPVPGATVVVRNIETQDARTLATDNDGYYLAADLAIGPYTVQVTHNGFKTAEHSGLILVADGRITTDFKLEVGDVRQSVDVVEARRETLNSVSGEIARVIDAKQVDNLALNGRNYSELMTLVPGAIVTNPDQFSVNTSLSATNQVINGHRPDSNNLTVDGMFNMDSGSNGSLINNVSPEFIQEVKIQTSNFSAEYGRMSGVAFNVVTKNGSNRWHGGVFEFLRNDLFDARNFFAPDKTELRFNSFGWDLGGPIVRNKLFFFAGEEWKKLRQQQAPARETLPSTAELNGDLSAIKTAVNYPGTKTPIPGNVIPASLLTPDGRAIANVYRLAESQAALFTDRAVSNNTIFEGSNPLDYREDLIRVDYRFNEKHSLYGRWIEDRNTIYLPMGTGSSTDLPATPEIRSRPGKSVLLAETWILSPAIINQAIASASWNSQHYTPFGTGWLRSTNGFVYPQLFSGGEYDNGIPDVTISSFATFKGPSTVLISPVTDIQVADTISLVRGSHMITAGAVFIRNRKDQNGRPPYTGSITFNASGNSNTTGVALADALLSNFRTYSEANYDPLGFFRFSEPAVFVQDNWHVTRKLNLEIGLRYEYLAPIYTLANNISNFVPALYNPAQAVQLTPAGTIVANSGNPFDGLQRAGMGVPSSQLGRVPGGASADVLAVPPGAPRGLYRPSNTFAPRFGFAYSLTTKTVLRGGFGLFYDRPDGNLIFSAVNTPPYTQTREYENGNLSNIRAGLSDSLAPFGNINTIDPALKAGYSEQFSFGVQRELPLGFFWETSYVGTLGRHLLRQPDINQASFDVLATNAALPTNQQASTNYLRPYHGYSSIYQYTGDSTSNYHGLQVYVSKRSGAVLMTAGYTWSKVLTDASSETDHPENYFDRHFSYGPATFDRRHAFVGTYIWQLPWLKQRNMLVRRAAGGWLLSGIVRLQTGPEGTVTGSTAIRTRRADYLGGPVLAPENVRGPNDWLSKSAFSVAPPSRYGDAGAGTAIGPDLRSLNLSLAKLFHLSESITLRLRADFFNALNRANFNTLSRTISSGNFGTISTAYPPREIQFGITVSF